MEDNQQTPKRNNESKSNSTVWFALIVVASVAVALFLLLSQSQRTLNYDDFQKLVLATKYVNSRQNELVSGSESNAKIVIPESDASDSGRLIEFSRPNDFTIGEKKITGFVDFRVVAGVGQSETYTRLQFQVNIDSSDSFKEALKEMLDSSNVKYRFSNGPSAWEKYGFFLLTMLCIVGLFYLMMRRLGGAGGPMQFGRSRGRVIVVQ